MPRIEQENILPFTKGVEVESVAAVRHKNRDEALSHAERELPLEKTDAIGAVAAAAAYVSWKKNIDVTYPPHSTLPQYGDPHPGTHFASLKRAWSRRKTTDFIIF